MSLSDALDDFPLPEPEPAPLETLERIRVAFQGELGAFSEEAVHRLWGGAAEPVPRATFEDVMDAAESGDVDYGLLPLESTLVGGLDIAYDLLSLHDGLCIVAEVIVPVRLCLLALPGATLAGVRTVASHPVMLGQCTHFLARHRHITAQPAWDTAGAARDVMEMGDPTRAAAGTRRAAERFGLEVLLDHIEDRPDSQMRFVAVATEPAPVPAGVPARSAVLCVLPHAAGALLAAIRPIAEAEFEISHLATRPTREPWTYQFFLEFQHPGEDPRARDALDAIRRASAEYRYLGTYPRWDAEARRREEDELPW
jgi:prephenate dehydratase